MEIFFANMYEIWKRKNENLDEGGKEQEILNFKLFSIVKLKN